MTYENKMMDKKHAKVPVEKHDRDDRQNNHQLGKNKAMHEFLAQDLGEYSDICPNINKNFINKNY